LSLPKTPQYRCYRFRSSLGDIPEDLVASIPESVVVFHYA
jgi:hypothetical protein